MELSDPAGAVLADEIGMVTIIDDDGASLLAATAPIEHVGKDDALSHDALTPIVEAAKARWTDAMALNPATLELLDAVSFEIVGLPGLLLGQVVGNTVLIDLNGAGHGWFVDSTPYDDAEFQEGSWDGLLATYSSPAHGDMDLLTVIMHKIGHVFGLEDLDSRTGDLMSPNAGRRCPSARCRCCHHDHGAGGTSLFPASPQTEVAINAGMRSCKVFSYTPLL